MDLYNMVIFLSASAVKQRWSITILQLAFLTSSSTCWVGGEGITNYNSLVLLVFHFLQMITIDRVFVDNRDF